MTKVFVFMMGRLPTVSKRAKGSGIVLIVIVGLLNFHVPHFLLESPKSFGSASSLLELALLANLLGAGEIPKLTSLPLLAFQHFSLHSWPVAS